MGLIADSLKHQLRTDLRSAMKARRSEEVRVLRALVSALDQAEAPPAATGSYETHDFRSGTAEAARLDLDGAALNAVIEREIEEREQAAGEFERLGLADRADEMRGEARVLARYMDRNADRSGPNNRPST